MTPTILSHHGVFTQPRWKADVDAEHARSRPDPMQRTQKWLLIPATIALLRAHFDRNAGKIPRAKARIQKIQLNYPDAFEFLNAFYGYLLITERNIEEAEKYFLANIESLPAVKDDSQRYVELYCRYFLGAQQENFDWLSLISEAERLKPEPFYMRTLPLPTKEQIEAVLYSERPL